MNVRAVARSETVGAMVPHVLGVAVSDGGGLDAEVAEHGIGLPAAKEADGIRVHASAEEGGGTARTE